MKKISFNDKFMLTKSVLDGDKTMVRFVVPQRHIEKAKAYQQEYYEGALERISIEDALLNMAGAEKMITLPYKVGEVVAVAQAYNEIVWHTNPNKPILRCDVIQLLNTNGATNKARVKAEYMPHHIIILGVKVEQLQKISEGDAMREGIIRVNKTSRVIGCYPYYTYRGSRVNAVSAKAAFISLMCKLRKPERQPYPREVPATVYNPYLYAYDFELVD